MKKLFAVLLALVLVLSMGTAVFAATEGKITISNAEAGETYDIYKMLDFTPIEGENNKGIYTVDATSPWAEFFNGTTAAGYFDVEEINDGAKLLVSLKADGETVNQALASAAIAYAKAKNITPTATETANSATVEFAGLALGYYAVDTSLGTLCALTNTNSTETLIEKNAKPGITKEVQEDRDDSWGKVNDANIGQVVNYKSVITVGHGVTNYEMHDTMDEGLTFNADSVLVNGAKDGFTVVTDCDDCTFKVVFTDEFINAIGRGNTFEVTYSATLNEKAKVAHDKGEDDYEGNKNSVYLQYFNESVIKTEPQETVTFTWKMDVFKYTIEGDQKVALAGATFQLLDAQGNALTFNAVEGATVPTYVVDPNGAITDIVTDENGEFVIIGLDEAMYTLTETKAPDGYNRAKDIEVDITSELDQANYVAEYLFNNNTPAKIEVENKTGGLFPETGGMGTTLFYLIGGLLMVAAVVVFVSKRRMASFM